MTIPTDIAKLRRRVNIRYEDVVENIPTASNYFVEDYLQRIDQTEENTETSTNVAQELGDVESSANQANAKINKQSKQLSKSFELIAELDVDNSRLNAVVKNQQKQINSLRALINDDNSLLSEITKIKKEIRNLKGLINGN